MAAAFAPSRTEERTSLAAYRHVIMPVEEAPASRLATVLGTDNNSLERTASVLRAGGAVAFPFNGIYVLCGDADNRRAADLITRAVALAPANTEFLVNLAEVHRRMNNLGQAEAALRRAAALAPPGAPETASIWYNLGVVLRGFKPAEAIGAFQRAITLNPAMAESHNNLAVLRHQAGEPAAAVDSFRRALALRPGHAETENNLGMALWSAGREHEALASFRAAVKIRPTFAFAHLNLGAAQRKLGRSAEALATLRTAAQLDGQSPEIRRELGRILLATGRLDDAIDACRRATELAPDDADAFQDLGVALAAKSARDPTGNSAANSDAIAAYQRALELKPDMPHWAFELAALRGQTPAAAPSEK